MGYILLAVIVDVHTFTVGTLYAYSYRWEQKITFIIKIYLQNSEIPLVVDNIREIHILIAWVHQTFQIFFCMLQSLTFKMLSNALNCFLIILKQRIVEQIFSSIHRNNVGRRTQFVCNTDLLCFITFVVIPWNNKYICHSSITKNTLQVLKITL